MSAVTVIDYGIGNLHNVVRAFEHCGAEVVVAETPAAITAAERLVLPGVGAFADGMAELAARGMVEPIRAYAAAGKPFIGICLGMQLMFESSTEYGSHAGLGLIPGEVVAIPAAGPGGHPRKIPHIGWNALLPAGAPDPFGPASLLGRLAPGTATYFVHSFMAVPADPATRLAECDYDGERICAAIRRENLYGCQFHPEKSGEAGLDIIRSFLAL